MENKGHAIANMYHGLAKNFLDIDPLSNANKDLDG
jgi:hypothetical protein